MPSAEPRFAVFDYPYETDEKPPRHLSKLVFIGWSPDNSDVKLKMVYASAKITFKNKLGMAKDLQAVDLSDVSLDFFFQKMFFWIIFVSFFLVGPESFGEVLKTKKEEEKLNFKAKNEN